MRLRSPEAVFLAVVATVVLQPRSIFEPQPFVAEVPSPDTIGAELTALHGAAAALMSSAVEASSRAWHAVARASSAVHHKPSAAVIYRLTSWAVEAVSCAWIAVARARALPTTTS